MMNEVDNYTEMQWNRTLWYWSILVGIALLMWYGFYEQIIAGRPFGNNPAPDNMLIALTAFFGFVFPIVMLSLHLVTKVDEEGIRIRMSPLPGRFIPSSEIDAYYARTYNALCEYGGWGIRFGRHGRAYNMSGRDGVELVLKNGSRVLVGTHDPEGLTDAMSRYWD